MSIPKGYTRIQIEIRALNVTMPDLVRAVCAIPTNSLNKTFATFGRALKKDRYLESIQAHLLNLPSYRRFPRVSITRVIDRNTTSDNLLFDDSSHKLLNRPGFPGDSFS